MSRFIKLTNFILNANNIHKISIKPNKYYIYIINNKFDGFSWRFAGSGIGSISTSHDEMIEICEINHSLDYKILSDWISKNC
jgi:hypothetical protein